MVRILLVDDEPDVLLAIQSLLSIRLHAHVTTAASGREALQLLRPGRFDLLVTDHRMPGLTGIGLIPLAKRQSPGLRCVLFTAYRDQPLERTAQAAGADLVLSKSGLPADFVQRIREVLSRP